MIKTSTIADSIKLSLVRSLFNETKKYDDVIDFTLGDPDVQPHQAIKNAACSASRLFFLGITDGVSQMLLDFSIFVNEKEYGKSRDQLYFEMRDRGILGRRYFYPLISTFSTYRGLPSASPENLPVATRIANEVICLPMHHALSDLDVERVINYILMKG